MLHFGHLPQPKVGCWGLESLNDVCHRACAPQSQTAGYQTASPRTQRSFVQLWLCSWLIG